MASRRIASLATLAISCALGAGAPSAVAKDRPLLHALGGRAALSVLQPRPLPGDRRALVGDVRPLLDQLGLLGVQLGPVPGAGPRHLRRAVPRAAERHADARRRHDL